MKYENPIIEVMELETEDIVCGSGLEIGGGDNDGNNGNGGWIESN